jgi:uncharacterized membrane protein
LVKVLVSGIVALLPVVGVIVAVAYFENTVAAAWLKNQGFYFFGLGIILAAGLVYLVGLTVSTFVGRWLWKRFDFLLDQVPILGSLYQTLKQILGYGEGPQGMFQRVVWMPSHNDRLELGLVTREACAETAGLLVVFLPAAPTPTSGRLVCVRPERVIACNLSASQAMQLLVSLGSIGGDSNLLGLTTGTSLVAESFNQSAGRQ